MGDPRALAVRSGGSEWPLVGMRQYRIEAVVTDKAGNKVALGSFSHPFPLGFY